MNRHGPGRRRRRAQRTYRLIVRLYPARYRRAFGEDMVQTFGDHYRDAVEGGGESRLRFWLAVLSDARTSLLTEYAAEARTRVRRRPHFRRPAVAQKQQPRAARQTRVARRLQYHRRDQVPARRPRFRRRDPGRARAVRRLRARGPARVLIRGRHHRLVYRGRIAALIALAVLLGVTLGTAATFGHLDIGAPATGAMAAAWLAYHLRLVRPLAAGPGGGGPAPPGGASVREPRRPLPTAPAGCAARPAPDQDDPGQAIALI